jgi:acylphosphatase
MMKKASLRIRGDVQMAGFRTYIKTVADSLNLNGFAENEEDGSVKVVCEGEGEAIERLINSVKQNSPSFVRIEEVKAVYEDYKGEFSGFERRGVDVLGEGESEMVALMRSFDKKGEVMIGILSSMNETLKGVKGDTSRILEKQDETIDAIDQSKEEIVTEISSLRGDLRLYMEEKFAKIEYELEAIKAKIGMV